MFFELRDIQRIFDPQTVARARGYVSAHRVADVRFNASRDVVRASVQGSGSRPYAVRLTLHDPEGRPWLEGACSCPVGHNCKHAAALALSLLEAGSGARRGGAPDGAVEVWAESIVERFDPSAQSHRAERLEYVVDMVETRGLRATQLAAFVVPTLKSGLRGKPRPYGLHNLTSAAAAFVTPFDRVAGRLVSASGLLGMGFETSPRLLGMLFALLADARRLHWRTIGESPLECVPLDGERIVWQTGEDGLLRVRLERHPAAVPLPADPLWYVDAEANHAGPVDIGASGELAALLARAPALEPAQAERAQLVLSRVLRDARVAGPAEHLAGRIDERAPIPVLRLDAFGGGRAGAELRFAYGESLVAPGDPGEAVVALGASAALRRRDRAFEHAARERLDRYDVSALDAGYVRGLDASRFVLTVAPPTEERWLHFLERAVPELREEGWRVDVAPSFPYRIVETVGDWTADVYDSGSPQWFELELGIEVDGARVSLLPVLIDALARSGLDLDADPASLARREAPFVGRIASGAYVALPAERVARVLATLGGLFGDRSRSVKERVRVPTLQAPALGAASGVVTRWSNAPSIRALLDDLEGFAARRVTIPQGFSGELRPYQRVAVAWLQTLRAHGAGGILADDMGLGKTVEVLAHVAVERAAKRLQRPVLVICPTSVVPNWRAEIARFLPGTRVLSLTGADRFDRFGEIAGAEIVLTTYALLVRDVERLAELEWSIAVLDEAQFIKNPRAKAAIGACRLRARQRLALTGTPVENHLEELWSIFTYAVPGLLPERARFARLFRTPIEKRGDADRRAALAVRIKPFLLRRTKEGVAQELPEKSEIVQRIELSGRQRDLYETIRLTMHKRVRDEVERRGLARSRIVVLDALLKLRQVCCDPRLLKLEAAADVNESQKLEALMEMLESLIDDGRRILLFSQFTSMLDLIKPELQKRGQDFVELRGSTRDREAPVARFQSGAVPLFLISLKAGGTGLNLTAADTVIHYDPWWNPAVERQATDRAHRIGQEQHVFVYKLIAENTVEERILELQDRKGALAASLFDDAADAKLDLSLDDIDQLFR